MVYPRELMVFSGAINAPPRWAVTPMVVSRLFTALSCDEARTTRYAPSPISSIKVRTAAIFRLPTLENQMWFRMIASMAASVWGCT